MRNSFSVKTILRKDKIKSGDINKHPLYYQIIFNSQKTKLPSGKFCSKDQWDEKKRCVKNSLLKNILIKEENRIYNILLEMDNNSQEFTLDNVKRRIKGHVEEKINSDFYFHLNEILKNKFAIEELAEGTKEHYSLLIKRLKSFKPKLTLDEINSRFIDDFVYYLKVELASGNSGTNNVIKCLNTVLKKFVIEKKIIENPCKHYKKLPEESSIIFLNPDELKSLINADLKLGNLTRGLEHTRNLFLFSCYTGLRDSDIKTLKKRDIVGNSKIVKRQVKTKEIVEIPFNEYWYEILKKNEFAKKRDDDLVLKYASNAAINRNLKLIAKIAKIKKRLHFHAGRHTFGSLLALQGVPIHLIAKYMGHKNIKTTQIYMNCDEETSAKVMKNVKF